MTQCDDPGATWYTKDDLKVTAANTTLQDGLVARYSFDAGDATDDSGNGHDGVIGGDATGVVGKIGTGM